MDIVLENWGVPVFSDHVLDRNTHDHISRRVTNSLPVIGEGDIFLLVRLCASWPGIQDFRRTIAYRSIRYSAMIVSFWLRGGTQSSLRTSKTSIDTALTGDPWEGTWSVYASGGIQSHQFDMGPSKAEIRTLKDCYRLAGLTCEDDPDGISRTHAIPNSAGKVAIISSAGYSQYSRQSHLPLFNRDSLFGAPIAWKNCTTTGEQPTHVEKLIIPGGLVGILDAALTPTQCENTTPLVYPAGVARRILRAAPNHFRSQLPSSSTCGRAGGGGVSAPQKPPVGPARDCFPNFTGQVFGQDRLSAVLSGIAPSTRMRYLQNWTRWESFMAGRQQSPWIWRTCPDWGDNLIDFILFGAKVVSNNPGTIRGRFPSIRFWPPCWACQISPWGGWALRPGT